MKVWENDEEETIPRSLSLRIGRTLCVIAGFISLVGVIVSFGASLFTISYLISAPFIGITVPEDVADSIFILALVFFIIAILSIVGGACGWAAGMNPWKKEKLRLIRAEIIFQIFVGALILAEGIFIEDILAPRGMFGGPAIIWAMVCP